MSTWRRTMTHRSARPPGSPTPCKPRSRCLAATRRSVLCRLKPASPTARNRKITMTAQPHDSSDGVVMGAGPAGLAVARELEHRHGIETLVIDRAAAPAISWRTRYDNFRLNTTGFLSHLPGQRIPLAAGRWPSRDDMVRYFDNYVRRQNITLELGCEVNGVIRAGGRLATRHIVWRNPNAGNHSRHGQLPHSHHPFLARAEPLQRRVRALRELQ